MDTELNYTSNENQFRQFSIDQSLQNLQNDPYLFYTPNCTEKIKALGSLLNSWNSEKLDTSWGGAVDFLLGGVNSEKSEQQLLSLFDGNLHIASSLERIVNDVKDEIHEAILKTDDYHNGVEFRELRLHAHNHGNYGATPFWHLDNTAMPKALKFSVPICGEGTNILSASLQNSISDPHDQIPQEHILRANIGEVSVWRVATCMHKSPGSVQDSHSDNQSDCIRVILFGEIYPTGELYMYESYEPQITGVTEENGADDFSVST